MKTNVLYLSFCIVALISFRASAQTYDPLIINDTTSVPLIDETPTFDSYNFLYKQRLDSLQAHVPLTYNESVQKYIDIYSNRKDQFGKMLGLSGYYFPIFEEALKSYDIPEEFKYLPIVESNMNPHAVSRVGATGIWQFMFGTAKGYGLNMDSYVDERKDPVQASYAAAAYFRDAYNALGDWLLVIASYNCGQGAVSRAVAKAGSRDFWDVRKFLPQETRNYVPAFIAAVYVMNFSKEHNISLKQSEMMMLTDSVQVNRHVSLPKLAKALGMDEDLLYRMNPAYKRKIVNGSEAAPKYIVMPRQTMGDLAMVYSVLNEEIAEEPAMRYASNSARQSGKSSSKSSPAVLYHRVSRGQNLSVIADRYNVDVQDIKVWNKLKSARLVPGQRLIVSKQVAQARPVAPKPTKQYISYKADNGGSAQSGKI